MNAMQVCLPLTLLTMSCQSEPPQAPIDKSTHPNECPVGTTYRINEDAQMPAGLIGVGSLSEPAEATLVTEHWCESGTGLREGSYLAFTKGGKKMYAGVFKGGKKHGTWSVWNRRGEKTVELSFKDNVRQGRPVFYSPTGGRSTATHDKNGAAGQSTPRKTRPQQEAAVANGLRKTGDGSYEIKHEVVVEVLSNTTAWSQSVRVIPDFSNGKVRGHKLVSLSSGSVPWLLGLREGDTMVAVNRLPLNTPEGAVHAREVVVSADQIGLEILRAGAPMRLTFIVTRR